MQIPNQQSRTSKNSFKFGLILASVGLVTTTLFSFTTQKLHSSLQSQTNIDQSKPNTLVRLAHQSTNESPEKLFLLIPEEDKIIPNDNPSGNWPASGYSMFNFKNDKTWESNPSFGKGENYPGLDKTCDSSKVSTQGIAGPATSFDFGFPVKEPTISSYFGWRKIYGRIHYGIDFVDKKGTPIIASERGTVTTWTTGKNSGSFGIFVELNHGDNFTTLYAHLSNALVKAGDHVEKGDIIGYMGSTGNTKATHVHFEIRHQGIPYNPFLGYIDLPSSDDIDEPAELLLEIPYEE